MERNRLTALLAFFFVVVLVMVFLNDRVTKDHFRTSQDTDCIRNKLVFRDVSHQPPHMIDNTVDDSDQIKGLLEKIQQLESQVQANPNIDQLYREARERVNKLELKLYESEKRLKIFGGSDNVVAPRNGSYPNFIIVGTWKGGTTSLHKMLQEHPNVCLALGEVNFFSRPNLRDAGMGLYYKFFERCLLDPKKQHKKANKGKGIKYSTAKDIVVGEKSPTYLWNGKSVWPHIKKVNPNAKIIVSLRNPIDRAFSNWYMDWCKGVFNGTFEEFINKSSKPLEVGHYVKQMKVLHEYFSREQIFAIKTEEFFVNPHDLIHRLENFLGVPHYNFTDDEIRTYGSSPKCQKRFGRPSLDPQTLEKLLEYFRESNAELEEFMSENYGWSPLEWDKVSSLKESPPNNGTGSVIQTAQEDEEDENDEISESTEDEEVEENKV
eukprot:TRINITY_DN15846_c0_g1_i1.p1 TRINITY_DN15846_c0_g1~~TRINITY_DN15846_c0_g1_i1.p1  ORF type:complete len:435 (-),score=110.91 TRINITY_DN15846_c0_g1_i1:15-1319(-)